MTQTLKQRYGVRQSQALREYINATNTDVILEHRTANLIIEAMDDEDLNKVAAIIQKLSSIKNPKLPKLTAAIEQAEAEINKYTAGGPITKGWAKMKNLVGIDNPVVKVTTFANALEKGFSQVPIILKNNGVKLDASNSDRTISDILSTTTTKTGKIGSSVTGKKDDDHSTPDLGEAESNNPANLKANDEKVGDDDKERNKKNASKLKTVIAQLQKALSPGGIYGVFKKVPYINSTELVQELVTVPLSIFSDIVKKIQSGAQSSEVAADIKSQASGQGAAETKSTASGQDTQKTSQQQPGAPTKDATTSSKEKSTGEATPEPQGGGAEQNYAAARTKLVALFKTLKKKNGSYDMDAITKKLVDAGLDTSKL